VGAMEVFATLEKREYSFSAHRDFIQLIVLSFLAFSIPFIFPGPQLLTGVIVNLFLVFAALGMRGNNIFPVIMLPSLGALANGLLFGPFTIFLAYMIPFIWIGNFFLVFGIKELLYKFKLGFGIAGVGATILKAGAIFLPAYGLYLAGVVPEALLVPMGILQVATALCAVILVGVGKRMLGK